MKNKGIISDQISRTDLVDFKISRTISAIEDEKAAYKASLSNRTEVIQIEQDEVKLNLYAAKQKAIVEAITEEYSEIISFLKKEGTLVEIFTYFSNTRPYFLLEKTEDNEKWVNNGYSSIEAYIIVASTNKITVIENLHASSPFGESKKLDNLMQALKPSAMVSIDLDSLLFYTTPEVAELEMKLKALRDEAKTISDTIHSFDVRINGVRAKKDQIKNNIIEVALGQSKEGQALLDKLNSIDLDSTLKLGQ